MRTPKLIDNIKEPFQGPTCTGVILAGGASRRMGRENKALMKIGGSRIIERVLGVLQSSVGQCVIITNTPGIYEYLGAAMHRDIVPGFAALGGLYTGLVKIKSEYAFLAACDMPFLNGEIIALMLDMIGRGDVIVPRVNGMYEPLHAIYSKRCIPYIEELMIRNDLKILNLYDKVKLAPVEEKLLREIDPELRSLINVNTHSDIEAARMLIGDH